MATELFRVQLLAAKSQNRSGELFFRHVEPLLFCASKSIDALQQSNGGGRGDDALSLMTQIVSDFKTEMGRLCSSPRGSSNNFGLPGDVLVDRFVRQFSSAAAMACSSSYSAGAAQARASSASTTVAAPSLAALLLSRPSLLSVDSTAATAPTRHHYRLFEAHANMLLDALESPSSRLSALSDSNAAGHNNRRDIADDEVVDAAVRHQRASVLLSPSKKPAKRNDDDDDDDENKHHHDGAASSSSSLPSPMVMMLSASSQGAVRSSTQLLARRLQPPILVEFAEFLRRTLLVQDPAVRAVWARVVEARTLRKVEELCDPLEQTRQFAALLAWKRSVLEPLVKILVVSDSSSPAQRSEVDQWMGHCGDFLCRAVARRRLESIFDDIVDFPDSRPHLQDVADAVARQPALLHEVARVAKAAITTRLQHAGASTGNVLFLVSQTCRALCVVRPGKAAGEALLRQVCDTTIRHLRARTDAVAAVVAAITDTQNQESNAWARRVVSPSSAGEAAGGGGGGGGISGAGAGGVAQDDAAAIFAAAEEVLFGDAAAPSASSSSSDAQDGPDILRMLLSVLTVPVVVKEYCRTLSERLLRQRPYSVDVNSEKEVLERLKVLLGEDACANAAVILKDFETSRRWCAVSAREKRLPEHATTTIVSAACWPTAVSDGPVAKLKLHPSLAGVSAKVNEAFHTWKQNQSLCLLPHHGFVEISLAQRTSSAAAAKGDTNHDDGDDDVGNTTNNNNNNNNNRGGATTTTRRKFRINLVAASVVMYLSEQQPRPLKALADLLCVTSGELAQCLQQYAPQLFLLRGADIELQPVAVGDQALDDASGGDGEDGADVLRKQAGSVQALPAGLTQGAVDMMQQMLWSMISNTGAKTGAQMEQSMRMLGQFSGSAVQFREVLTYFVQKNIICSDGSGTYRLAAAAAATSG